MNYQYNNIFFIYNNRMKRTRHTQKQRKMRRKTLRKRGGKSFLPSLNEYTPNENKDSQYDAYRQVIEFDTTTYSNPGYILGIILELTTLLESEIMRTRLLKKIHNIRQMLENLNTNTMNNIQKREKVRNLYLVDLAINHIKNYESKRA
jgi:hypothetical protein